MPMFQLKDGRTVSDGQIVDFDATHTNCVSRLTTDEYAEFVASAIPDPPPLPVTTVTQVQARLALNGAGLLAKVDAAVAAADQPTQIAWNFSSTIDRNNPLITSVATGLGLSSAQIDALFAQAATL